MAMRQWLARRYFDWCLQVIDVIVLMGVMVLIPLMGAVTLICTLCQMEMMILLDLTQSVHLIPALALHSKELDRIALDLAVLLTHKRTRAAFLEHWHHCHHLLMITFF